MDTFDKLDKVDLQILRTLQENALNGWRMEAI